MLAFINLQWFQQIGGIVMEWLPIVWLFLGWMSLRALRRIVGGKSKSVSFSVHDGVSKGQWDEFKALVLAQMAALRESTANQMSNFEHRLTGIKTDNEKFLTGYKGDSKAMEERIKETYFKSIKLFDRDFEQRTADIVVLVMAMAHAAGEFKIDLESDVELLKDQLFGTVEGSLIAPELANRIKTFAHILDYKPRLQDVAGKVVENQSAINGIAWKLIQNNIALVSQDRVLKQVCELPHVSTLLPEKSQLEELAKAMHPIILEAQKQIEQMSLLKRNGVQGVVIPVGPKDHPITSLIPESEGGDPECDTGKCLDCDEDEDDCWCDDKPTKKKPLKKKWPKKAPVECDTEECGDPRIG